MKFSIAVLGADRSLIGRLAAAADRKLAQRFARITDAHATVAGGGPEAASTRADPNTASPEPVSPAASPLDAETTEPNATDGADV